MHQQVLTVHAVIPSFLLGQQLFQMAKTLPRSFSAVPANEEPVWFCGNRKPWLYCGKFELSFTAVGLVVW
jgi:hypothetical protein